MIVFGLTVRDKPNSKPLSDNVKSFRMKYVPLAFQISYFYREQFVIGSNIVLHFFSNIRAFEAVFNHDESLD